MKQIKENEPFAVNNQTYIIRDGELLVFNKSRKARMPWDGRITHTRLPDGRTVERGSEEHARVIMGVDQ